MSVMKKTSIIGVAFAFLGLGAATTSCEDMLTPDMTNHVEGDAAITDTVYYFHGILKSVQNIAERTVILGEARGDLTTTATYVSDSIYDIANFAKTANGSNGLLDRSAYYKVINECNHYIAHADSMATNNSQYYLRRELAQVQMIRAWTYMQLVINYGSVPFITEPVDNANTGWEYSAPKATRENLLDLLGDDLKIAKAWSDEYGLPNYRSYDTYGGVTIPSQLCMFPPELVLGDLYLLRGASQEDYAQAAQYYYDYIVDHQLSISPNNRATFSVNNYGTSNQSYSTSTGGWLNAFQSYTYGGTNGLCTVIPSCAVSTMGTVLTDVQQIYGFELTSSQSASTSTGDDDEEETTVTGSIVPSPSEQYRQLGPSTAYLQLNAAQNYAGTRRYSSVAGEDELEYYANAGDARLDCSAPNVRTSEASTGLQVRSRYINKFCPTSNVSSSFGASGFSFHYAINIYRAPLIYLRYAEALNRAGFPQHAFALLTHGLNAETVPGAEDILDSVRIVNGQPERVYYIDPLVSADPDFAYFTVDELRRAQAVPYINTTTFNTLSLVGIHSYGCGDTTLDTLYTYNNMVAQKIADESLRLGSTEEQAQSLAKRYLRQAVDGDATEGEGTEGEGGEDEEYPNLPDPVPAAASELEINAIEDVIVDELALETAFEGNRFPDLMRFAFHKDASVSALQAAWTDWAQSQSANGEAVTAPTLPGNYGTEWMAWKISRRDLNLAPYEKPEEKDATLYQLLLDQSNWYLQNPN